MPGSQRPSMDRYWGSRPMANHFSRTDFCCPSECRWVRTCCHFTSSNAVKVGSTPGISCIAGVGSLIAPECDSSQKQQCDSSQVHHIAGGKGPVTHDQAAVAVDIGRDPFVGPTPGQLD